MARIFPLALLTAATLVAAPAFAQFGSIFGDPPPRPPREVPSRQSPVPSDAAPSRPLPPPMSLPPSQRPGSGGGIECDEVAPTHP